MCSLLKFYYIHPKTSMVYSSILQSWPDLLQLLQNDKNTDNSTGNRRVSLKNIYINLRGQLVHWIRTHFCKLWLNCPCLNCAVFVFN